MPTVNVFYQTAEQATLINAFSAELRNRIAQVLSGQEIKLSAAEVSIRLIATTGNEMIASFEVEITAHAFADRVDRQDEICLEIREYLQNKMVGETVQVWLLLTQLGHSWKAANHDRNC